MYLTASEQKTRRGFAVRCPYCSEKESVRVQADDLAIICVACNEVIEPAHVRRLIEEWQRLLAWIEVADGNDRG